MPATLPPSAYEAVASAAGYRWLGPYTGKVLIPTGWECPQGHQRLALLHNIKNGDLCPICSGRAPKSQDDYHALASASNLAFVGAVPRDTDTRTLWKCQNGHTFSCDYQHIKQGARCPICVKHEIKTAEHYHELAGKLGMIWSGTDLPRNTRSDTTWTCSNGHVIKRRFDAMRAYIKIPDKVCPFCSSVFPSSHGEYMVAMALDSLGVRYEIQKRFSGCKLKRLLPFDFYLVDFHVLIEYNGEQHFVPTGFSGKRESPQALSLLRAIQRRDEIKKQFAESHNIPLFIIPYTESHIESSVASIIAKL